MTNRVAPKNSRIVRNVTRRAAALLLAVSLLSASVFAGSPYVDVTDVDGIALLPPPPTPESPEGKADLNNSRAVFKARTAEEGERAKRHENLSIYHFAPAVGDFFEKGHFPKVDALFASVKTNISEIINMPKNHWKRLRPYQLDESLKFGQPEASFGYPSGHSTRGTVYALVMAKLFPDKKDDILEIGREIGWDRVLIGKHFQSDIYGGRVLGQEIFRALMKSPKFQEDLGEAKGEVEAARVAARPTKK
jgi:acid phosphatase (class A)